MSHWICKRYFFSILRTLAAVVVTASIAAPARAQEGATPPHWIWHPAENGQSEFPAETRYFRKAFATKEPSRLVLEVTADNAVTLYLDGKPVASSSDWHATQRYEAKLAIGKHVLAAVASNEAPGPAGLLVSGGILPLGQGVPIHSNSSWRTASIPPGPGDDWKNPSFDDSRWPHALDLGKLGTSPWGMIASSRDAAARFQVPEGLRVDMAAAPEVTGSVIAFTFDPDGAPCISVEGGPIARLVDQDKDGHFDRREVIESQVRNCQGISFIRGRMYAVGHGPDGAGIYRLSDANKDGNFEECELVRAAAGGMGEHGPHAVLLGPDGMLYYNNGNHAHLKPPIDPASPVNIPYEGELLPHYNDARGHAAGIMAPGGEILRSDDDGKTWKRVVAGFRNEYDFAFHSDGELFTFDSDMEWDVGLPWYRPVRINHCPIGAEFGWRNGSGKWPAYFFDSLPGVFDVGRGSPTGVTFYKGTKLPAPYHDSFLVCDWSQGRILAIKLKRQGASYSATSTTLVSGQPLNCTDIEIGPDEAVYFTNGGRGTQGGLFRVVRAESRVAYADRPKPAPGQELAAKGGARDRRYDEIDEAVKMPSPLASFSQRRLAAIHDKDPVLWKSVLERTANEVAPADPIRCRALDLLCQIGPRPSEQMLVALAADQSAAVRARAVGLLGLSQSQPARGALEAALTDRDLFVRRHACEGLMQQPRETIPIKKLLPLLADADRFIRFSARVAIEHGPIEEHAEGILALTEPRPLIEGMLALVRASKLDDKRQDDLLAHETSLIEKDLEPELKCDLLRLIGLTYMLGPHKADARISSRLRPILLGLFSVSIDSPVNRETARLLAFLDEPRAVAAIVSHQGTVSDLKAQIHDAYCLRAIKHGWTSETKASLWSWYQKASQWEGGYSFQGYLDMMIQELTQSFDPGEKESYLAVGEQFPFPTRVLARELDLDSQPGWVPKLAGLYRKLHANRTGGMESDLCALIVEKLGRSRRPEAHAALRDLYRDNPGQSDAIARALATHPEEASLPILVAALDSRDLNTTSLVLLGLGRLTANPAEPEALVKLLRLARRSGPSLASHLNRLASRWTGVPVPKDVKDFEQILAAWAAVYHQKFPLGPALEETGQSSGNSYSLTILVDNVLHADVMKTASGQRGLKVIEQAKCLDCHKFGTRGQGLGPDLTTISSRFRPGEILESIVEPSKIISDQYKPVAVASVDGKIYNGMPVVSEGANLVLLLSDGTKVTIPRTEIDGRKESNLSVMPVGLINSLSYQEIADMLALFDSAPRVETPPSAKP
jgi:putative heme-binding domain-containing protein